MQPIIVAHILSRYLDAFLEQLADAYPYQPIGAVLNNNLRMTTDGNTANIEHFARKLYSVIKELELEEDPPFVLEHKDGTTVVNKPEQILNTAPELLKERPKTLKPDVIQVEATKSKPLSIIEEGKELFMEQFAQAVAGGQEAIDKLGEMVQENDAALDKRTFKEKFGKGLNEKPENNA